MLGERRKDVNVSQYYGVLSEPLAQTVALSPLGVDEKVQSCNGECVKEKGLKCEDAMATHENAKG